MTNITLSPDEILKAYSGKPGCACGCNGRYVYSSDITLRKQASLRRGYRVDDDEVSDRRIASILKKIKVLSTQSYPLTIGRTFISLQTETRVYTVYPAAWSTR